MPLFLLVGLLLSGIGAIGDLGILFAPLSTAAVWTFIAALAGTHFRSP